MPAEAARDAWVQYIKPLPHASTKLFCIPYAGGGASIYRSWTDVLPSDIQVCPVQLPGREWRIKEPPRTRMAGLVEELSEVLRAHIDRPYAVFGHSLGALIGFELLRKLSVDGLAPAWFFPAGHRAPQLPSSERRLHRVPDASFLMELRRLRGTPDEVLNNRELMRLLAPILRADFELAETYAFAEGPKLSCPVSAFCGIEDILASKDKMSGWGEHTAADFKIRMIPGGHFFLNESRDLLLKGIASDLLSIGR